MSAPRIDPARLMGRIAALGQIGALPGGGVCRLALSDAEQAGRDLLVGWMQGLGLEVTVDRIGNIVGTRAGTEDGLLPVVIGSHIDTVATGGLYDGAYGVLAGLELVEALNEAGHRTRRPLAVAAFTNEEGARFQPDMMGSAVHQGSLALEDALGVVGIDGRTVGAELDRIGYRGTAPTGSVRAHRYLELHIEQGPVLEEAGAVIGAVEGVQGISWTEYRLEGASNHAGTTPMRLRHDAGHVAMALAVEARRLARAIDGDLVATVGSLELTPNLVNVIPGQARLTLDLRHIDEAVLQRAERQIDAAADWLAAGEGVRLTRRKLARFAPVAFDRDLVGLVAAEAEALGLPVRHLPSGAGHDAQMFAPDCPTAMIFVPSRGGISHNVEEFTAPEHLRAGAAVLLRAVLACAG
jgi:N-carbamoyl-L-amino-acid hydrolase